MANEFIAKNGLISKGSITSTGNISSSGYIISKTAGSSITGSLLGTASWATNALASNTSSYPWITSGNNIYNGNSGNVGIGTTAPQSKLHLKASGETEQWAGILFFPELHDSANPHTIGAPYAGGLAFGGGQSVGDGYDKAELKLSGSGIYFLTGNGSSAPTNKMTVLNNGNVGINISSPLYKLDVSGSARIEDGQGALRLGTDAGLNSTTRNYGVQIGYGVGYNTTNASNAIQIGYQAGYYSYLAGNSILIGYQAGYNANTGSNATIIGYLAATSTLNATSTVIIGSLAAYSCPSAASAVIIGDQAARITTTATNAVIVGYGAGYNAKLAASSVIIGDSAGYNSITASSAIQIGYRAGYSSTTSSYAVQIGYQAGYGATNASNAVMIGTYAGYNASKGNYSTFIGYASDTLSSNLNVSKSIAIGYNAKVSASNICAIGGTGVDAVKVTIGGTNAVNTLDVTGNISCSVITASLFFGTSSISNQSVSSSYSSIAYRAYFADTASVTIVTQSMITAASWASASLSSSYAASSSYPWISSGSNIYNGNTGNVGIGITTPESTLHVYGQSKFTPRIGSTNALMIDYIPTTNDPRINGAQDSNWGISRNGNMIIHFMSAWTSYYGNSYFVDSVGIGVTYPPEKLTVVGNISSSGYIISKTAGSSITGSLLGTASFATTAGTANAISFVPLTSISSSWASSSITASYAPVQPSYSASVSTLINNKQDTLITGGTYNITSSNSISASWAPQTQTISCSFASSSISSSYAPVQPSYSSSVSSLINTKQDTLVTGNTYTITSSWSNNSITSAYCNGTSAYANNATSAAFATTAAFATNALTSAYCNGTSAYATVAGTANAISFVPLTAISSSWASASKSSSYAPVEQIYSASVSTQFGTKQDNLITGNTYNITSSWATNALSAAYNSGTSAYASNANSAAFAANADTLDSQHGLYYLDSANHTGVIPVARLTGSYNITSSVSINANTSSFVEQSGDSPRFLHNPDWGGVLKIDGNLERWHFEALPVSASEFIGNLTGTSSYALNSKSSSYSSYASRSLFAVTASYAVVTVVTQSVGSVISASWASASLSSSFVNGNFSNITNLTCNNVTAFPAEQLTLAGDFVNVNGSDNLTLNCSNGEIVLTAPHGTFSINGTGLVSDSTIAANKFVGPLTGSVHGTSSWARNVISSSYSLTASYALNATSSNLFYSNTFNILKMFPPNNSTEFDWTASLPAYQTDGMYRLNIVGIIRQTGSAISRELNFIHSYKDELGYWQNDDNNDEGRNFRHTWGSLINPSETYTSGGWATDRYWFSQVYSAVNASTSSLKLRSWFGPPGAGDTLPCTFSIALKAAIEKLC